MEIANSASFVIKCLVAGGQDFKGCIINFKGIIDIFLISQSTREIIAIKMCFIYVQKNSVDTAVLKKMNNHDDSLDLIG